jgi:hypothetical protein
VAEALHAELYQLKQVRDEPELLREFSYSIDRICRQLAQQSLDEDAPYLLTIAKSKLPPRVLTMLLEKEKDRIHSGAPEWKMADFRSALRDHIDVREEADSCSKAVKTAPVAVAINQAMHNNNSNGNYRRFGGGWNRNKSREPATIRTFSVATVGQQPSQRRQQPRQFSQQPYH